MGSVWLRVLSRRRSPVVRKYAFTVRLMEEISQVKSRVKIGVLKSVDSARSREPPTPRSSTLMRLQRGALWHWRLFMWLGKASTFTATLKFGGRGCLAPGRDGRGSSALTLILLAIFPRSTVVCEGLHRPSKAHGPWDGSLHGAKRPLRRRSEGGKVLRVACVRTSHSLSQRAGVRPG